jgi:hypothetical protein
VEKVLDQEDAVDGVRGSTIDLEPHGSTMWVLLLPKISEEVLVRDDLHLNGQIQYYKRLFYLLSYNIFI